MHLENVIAELRKELVALDAAIRSLEGLLRPGSQATVRTFDLATTTHTNGANRVYRSLTTGKSS